MSEIKVSSITDRAGTGKPNFSVHPTVDGSADPNSPPTRTESSTRPSSPREGDTWWDTANSNYEVYIDGNWEVMLGAGYVPRLWFGNRATVHGNNEFDYYDITTAGNASAWGSAFAVTNRTYSAAASDFDYVIVAGGSGWVDSTERFTIATAGSATTNWTTLPEKARYPAAASNTNVMHIAGGQRNSHPDNRSDFFSFTTNAEATQGGNLTVSRTKLCGCSDGTYGYYLNGQTAASSGYSNVMEYLNIGTTSTAFDFGNATITQGGLRSAASNTWRGLIWGGFSSSTNRIDWITLGTGGNAGDFGDALAAVYGGGASANSTKCCFAGGYTNTVSNVIQHVTIDTKGNAADFGDLTETMSYISASSGGT